MFKTDSIVVKHSLRLLFGWLLWMIHEDQQEFFLCGVSNWILDRIQFNFTPNETKQTDNLSSANIWWLKLMQHIYKDDSTQCTMSTFYLRNPNFNFTRKHFWNNGSMYVCQDSSNAITCTHFLLAPLGDRQMEQLITGERVVYVQNPFDRGNYFLTPEIYVQWRCTSCKTQKWTSL